MKYLILFLLAIVFLSYAETTGDLNLSQLPQPVVTGFPGATVTNCTQNYGNPPNGCGTYQCFFENGSTSRGSCRQTTNTDCYESLTWYTNAADTPVCKNTTHKYACSSGTWAATECTNGCSSGACAAATTTNTDSPPTSSSPTDSAATNTSAYRVLVTAGISDFSIVQNDSTIRSVTIKNNGNGTINNVTLSLSGIEWGTVSPAKFETITKNTLKTFTITIAIPANATVQEYTVTYNVVSLEDDAKDSGSFKLKVLPSNDTIENDIIPKYNTYLDILKSLENNITELKNSGADTSTLDEILSNIKEKLNQTNSSLTLEDYFAAATLMDEIDVLSNDLLKKIEEAKASQGSFIFLIACIVVVLIIVGIVVYMLLPPSSTKKLVPDKISNKKGFSSDSFLQDKKTDKILKKLKKKKKDAFNYKFGGK